MKSLRDIVAALLVAGAAITVPAIAGCYATEGAYVTTEEAPPATREEVVVARPGFLWIHGHWTHPGGHWLWRDGYYERERPSQVFVEGRWERRGRGHVWVEGGWRGRAHVSVRDHD